MPAASTARTVRPHLPLERLEATMGEEQSSKAPPSAFFVFESSSSPGAASRRRRHCVLATPLPTSETPLKVAAKFPAFEATGGSSVGAGTTGGSVSTMNEKVEGEEEVGLFVAVAVVGGGRGLVLPTPSVATTENW